MYAQISRDHAVLGRPDAARACRVVDVLARGTQPRDQLVAAVQAVSWVESIPEEGRQRRLRGELTSQLEPAEHGLDVAVGVQDVVEDPRMIRRVRRAEPHRAAGLRRLERRGDSDPRRAGRPEPVLPVEHRREVDLEVRRGTLFRRAPMDERLDHGRR